MKKQRKMTHDEKLELLWEIHLQVLYGFWWRPAKGNREYQRSFVRTLADAAHKGYWPWDKDLVAVAVEIQTIIDYREKRSLQIGSNVTLWEQTSDRGAWPIYFTATNGVVIATIEESNEVVVEFQISPDKKTTAQLPREILSSLSA